MRIKSDILIYRHITEPQLFYLEIVSVRRGSSLTSEGSVLLSGGASVLHLEPAYSTWSQRTPPGASELYLEPAYSTWSQRTPPGASELYLEPAYSTWSQRTPPQRSNNTTS
ncbi:hypothetical protein LSAT2_021971 [Lamellibrachia satsuma]|nr:hypothetical protein LSAT2_021971 [Lamellibrachia satsuma]